MADFNIDKVICINLKNMDLRQIFSIAETYSWGFEVLVSDKNTGSNKLYITTDTGEVIGMEEQLMCKYTNKLTNEFKNQDLEILVSTMNRNTLDFLIPMFPFCHFSEFSILIVNQTQENNLLHSDFLSVRVINSFEKGLSKSRNLALKNAKGKIVLLTDDDVVFETDFQAKIIDSFNNFFGRTYGRTQMFLSSFLIFLCY